MHNSQSSQDGIAPGESYDAPCISSQWAKKADRCYFNEFKNYNWVLLGNTFSDRKKQNKLTISQSIKMSALALILSGILLTI